MPRNACPSSAAISSSRTPPSRARNEEVAVPRIGPGRIALRELHDLGEQGQLVVHPRDERIDVRPERALAAVR